MKLELVALSLALAACSGGGPDQQAAPTADSANSSVTAPDMPTAKPVEESDKTEVLSWSLAYPAEVAAIPALSKQVRDRSLKQKAEYLSAAKDDKAAREKDGYEFPGYELSDTYEVAGSTPRLLSVSDNWYTFSGGAHPMHGTSAILWDRALDRPISFGDLFAAGAGQIGTLFGKPFCAELDEQRLEKRGAEDRSGAADDPFNACPDFAELAIIARSAQGGGPMTHILFHADPYVAGPYVEGDYDVELPVTPAFIAALKPEYRTSFSAAR